MNKRGTVTQQRSLLFRYELEQYDVVNRTWTDARV